MSQQLKAVIAETQEKFRLDPKSAIMHFESSSCLQEGLQSQARMRQHTLVVDEPVALGGADTGPNPVEIVLAGSFTAPVSVEAGDVIHADYGPLGAIGVSFA